MSTGDDECSGELFGELPKGIQRRSAKLRQNLEAWTQVLDSLGWCVALQLDAGPPTLSPRAVESLDDWLTGLPPDRWCWRELEDRLAAFHRDCFLLRGRRILVWQAAQADSPTPPPAPLTRRETEILDWLRQGKTAPEIALILGCAKRTVEGHVARLYRKLGVRNRTELFFSHSPPPP